MKTPANECISPARSFVYFYTELSLRRGNIPYACIILLMVTIMRLLLSTRHLVH